MKKLTLLLAALFFLNACKKESETNSISDPNSKEVSLVQEVTKLKNDKGEEVSVTYFAEGGVVAVKIQKTGDKEQKLSAKTTNAKGNPIFTNEEVMWEMTQDGKAGKLTDKAGNSSEYK
ncbi:hypothetical protein [Chryseobacterium koreense]|uniref:C-type lysozyme inhibitor domain-containing protein n=1 Tax=Chryseobacterium koreense CCUG 49689 TaxID=1304281 RepID=A0A0J7J1T1_9FLAO|nr:hypothetical protein [Chryseobacterium koreense]KMQ72016.1 hypothetical protein ACM44_03055 [Chryseobacterium koreense CCUG 49689]MBB5332114.1 hypothetical protein [Chryseobacterium koreense]